VLSQFGSTFQFGILSSSCLIVAVFAALLAKEGMSGPRPIFEGRLGFFKAVSGPFQFGKFGGNGHPFRIMKATIKKYPCIEFAQTAIDAAVKLRSKIAGTDEISQIKIGMCAFGKKLVGNDVEKWHPKTRESADHSLPYLIAVALKYGPIEVGHFADEYLKNPDLMTLMQKIIIEESAECEKLYPDAKASLLEITTKSNEKFSELVIYPRGHYQNPLTDDELEQKFYSLTKELLSTSQRKELLSLIWNLEQVDNFSTVMELIKI